MHPHAVRKVEKAPRKLADRVRRPELATALWRHGYDALPALRRDAEDPSAYPASLLGRPALVVRGEEGVRLFYDESLLCRKDALPRAVTGLLFGHGAVHGLDDEPHLDRKKMFLDVMREDQVALLQERVRVELANALPNWAARPPFSLFDELVRIYGTAVLDWAGTGCHGNDAERLSAELARVVDGFGLAGAAYPRGWLARLRVDGWARRVVAAARSGELLPRRGSIVDALTHGQGRGLPLDVAAVELVNVVRPTVAVAWLGAAAAVALADHPAYGAELADPEADDARDAFAHEVRRCYPFVPALAARVRITWTHRGHPIRPGHHVVLDVPGTNRDSRAWESPETFRPERFTGAPQGDAFVPQGGGEPTGHRCPGEGASQALLRETVRTLAGTAYRLEGNAPSRRRIPPIPVGGLMIAGVSPVLGDCLATP